MTDGSANGPVPRSIRLTFEYDGGEVTLKKSRTVEMRAPKSQDVRQAKDEPPRIGNWVEIRDDSGAVLYRQRTPPAIPTDVEIHPGGEEGSISRVPSDRSTGTFHVVVPAVDRAASVVLIEVRPPGKERREPEVLEHAVVSLDDVDDDQFHTSGAN